MDAMTKPPVTCTYTVSICGCAFEAAAQTSTLTLTRYDYQVATLRVTLLCLPSVLMGVWLMFLAPCSVPRAPQNLLCVIRGRKRVTLYPPRLTPFLYPAPLAGDSSNHSLVDFVAPDLNRHPLFRYL